MHEGLRKKKRRLDFVFNKKKSKKMKKMPLVIVHPAKLQGYKSLT